jgi:diguanylate cyclase (GGDEF)-like protein/PAS domain S-box-containing protein
MSLGLLWPLLRLTRAQRGTLSQELKKAEKQNAKLTAYQRALDKQAIFAVTSRMGTITHVNENFCRISGYLPEELLGQNHRLLNSGMHSPDHFTNMWLAISAGETWQHEVCNRGRDGGLYWVDTCIMPLLGADGKPEQFVSISYDITERKRAQLRATRKAHLDSLIDEMRSELFASGAMYGSMSGLLKELNAITGAAASLVCEVGRTVEGMAWSLVLGHFRSRGFDTTLDVPEAVKLMSVGAQPGLIQEVFQQDGLFGGMSVNQLGAERFRGIPISIGYEPVGVLLIADGGSVDNFADEIQLVVTALGDMISARRESDRRRNEEEKVRKQAKRDPLTGLGNRRDLAEQFDARTDHPDAKFSLLLIDLDRFKPINDTYGHLIGDTVLRVVAERLRSCARGDVTVARIGGDEFAILTEVHSAENEAGALELAHAILGELTAPIDCSGHSIQVGASVGVALYPRDGASFQELLHRADAAMYRAKGNRAEAQVFNASMDEAIRYRGELEADLKRAIDAGDITPYFQPYVDLRTGEVAGHEILARWRHAQRGFVSPAEFIKIAEDSGLVDKLFWQFLRSACAMHLQHKLTTVLSINLSPVQIKNPMFARQLVEELERLGFPPALLEVEITETSMIGDVERARPLLLLLRSKGIRIALDDFGTGYSSLALLRNMPISKVKIDKSFVIDVEGADGTGLTIVNAILGIAKALKLQVTAEGIETGKVSTFLRDMGCDYGQGYLFGRAEPEPVTESLQPDSGTRLSRVVGIRR